MISENNQSGIVYVLTNSEMPGLVKIGKTSQGEVEGRLSQLYSTGVPIPFECVYAARVSDAATVEKALHTVFEPHRVNPNREFFRIEPDQAEVILRLIDHEDVTPGVQEQADEIDADVRVAIAKRARRPNLNFEEMGILVGEKLKYIHSDETVEIVDSKRVKRNEEIHSLSSITKELLEIDGNVRPTGYWTYKGKPLSEIYEETYGPRDS